MLMMNIVIFIQFILNIRVPNNKISMIPANNGTLKNPVN